MQKLFYIQILHPNFRIKTVVCQRYRVQFQDQTDIQECKVHAYTDCPIQYRDGSFKYRNLLQHQKVRLKIPSFCFKTEHTSRSIIVVHACTDCPIQYRDGPFKYIILCQHQKVCLNTLGASSKLNTHPGLHGAAIHCPVQY